MICLMRVLIVKREVKLYHLTICSSRVTFKYLETFEEVVGLR
jgi:hypothetical protein